MPQTIPVFETNKNVGSDRLGRYYTKPDIGSLVVSQMGRLAPNRVLDLGAGSGSLSRAALTKWKNIELLTVDVDSDSRSHLLKLFKDSTVRKHSHIQADALSVQLPKIISATVGCIDAAVCNPPFITAKWRRGFAQIVEDAGFSGCLPVLSDVDATLLFLAQNLRMMSANATLGIILPDSLISAAKYRLFRKELINRYTVHKSIRLPRHSFQNTDAQAYLVVISKGGVAGARIPLRRLDAQNNICPELFIGRAEAIERLDFAYHANRIVRPNTKLNAVPLGSIALDIKRGSFSSSEARLLKFPVLHTTDIVQPFLGTWRDLRYFGKSPNHFEIKGQVCRGEPGDILLSRVGRNLEKKIMGVSRGFPILTDCVYKIRVPEHLQKTVFSQLSSPDGQAWLASRSHGVSATQLTKANLSEFPIFK